MDDHVHRAALAQHADRDEDGDQVWDDADGDLKPFFRAVDEDLVDRDAADGAKAEQRHHQARNDPGRDRAAIGDG